MPYLSAIVCPSVSQPLSVLVNAWCLLEVKQMPPVTIGVANPCKMTVSFVFYHPCRHPPILMNPLNPVRDYSLGQA